MKELQDIPVPHPTPPQALTQYMATYVIYHLSTILDMNFKKPYISATLPLSFPFLSLPKTPEIPSRYFINP